MISLKLSKKWSLSLSDSWPSIRAGVSYRGIRWWIGGCISMLRGVIIFFLFFTTVACYGASAAKLRRPRDLMASREMNFGSERLVRSVDNSFIPIRSLKYAEYVPRVKSKSIPLILYFGGSGESGDEIEQIFRQETFFCKVLDEQFQKKHPCAILAPLLPSRVSFHSGVPNRPSDICVIIHDLVEEFCKAQKHPQIDRSRIYVTGLSLGGAIAFELPAYYPGYFAASVPVSSFMNSLMVPSEHACDYWLVSSKTSFDSDRKKKSLKDLQDALERAGGSIRLSLLPTRGHNAWDMAWQEDGLWDWVFARSLSNEYGNEVHRIWTNVDYVKENGNTPDNVLDGLRSTKFISRGNAKKGDFWACEFTAHQKGRWRLETGNRKGVVRLSVYLSRTGMSWQKIAVTRDRDGACEFQDSTGFRFVKISNEDRHEGAFEIQCLRRVR